MIGRSFSSFYQSFSPLLSQSDAHLFYWEGSYRRGNFFIRCDLKKVFSVNQFFYLKKITRLAESFFDQERFSGWHLNLREKKICFQVVKILSEKAQAMNLSMHQLPRYSRPFYYFFSKMASYKEVCEEIQVYLNLFEAMINSELNRTMKYPCDPNTKGASFYDRHVSFQEV